jgi:acid phosphatase type 7
LFSDNTIASDKIVIYGDSRTNNKIHQKIVDDIFNYKPVAVFHTGDMVNNPNNKDHWKIFNDIISKLKETAKIYPVIGNHENNSTLYKDIFNLPSNKYYYSVDIDKIHFIVLDSNSSMKKSSEQYNWLINNIESASDSLFKIVLFHYPLFSSGEHEEIEDTMKDVLLPIFNKYNVHVVFNAHFHGYERLLYNNINFIITAGGGAPLDAKLTDNPYSKVYKKVYNYCVLYIQNQKLIIEL